MKKLFIFFLLTTSLYGKAQFISPEVVQKYPASVISRVYEVAFASLIAPEKQVKLAEFFMKKDSLITALAKNEASLKQIKETTDALQKEFERFFDPKEQLRYNILKYQSYAEADAKMVSAYVKQKYAAGEETVNALYRLNLSKNQRVVRVLMSDADVTKLNDSNFVFFQAYDSIAAKYIIAAKGDEYFESKLKELNKVKPLSDKQKKELHKNYVTLCLRNGPSYHMNFNVAMQFSVRDSAYYSALYKDSMQNIAAIACAKEMEHYVFRYGIPEDVKKKIKPLLMKKAERTAWLETRYPFSRLRDSLQTELEETTWARVKRELIRSGYTALGKSRFANAMSYQQVLGLSNGQMDTLADENLRLDLMIYTYKTSNYGAAPDYSRYVSGMMKALLREGQYDTLLLVEAQPRAIAFAKQNWSELVKHKLTGGVDSSAAMRSIIGYHMQLLVLDERYFNDRETYKERAKVARQSKPAILRQLDAIKRDEEAAGDESRNTK